MSPGTSCMPGVRLRDRAKPVSRSGYVAIDCHELHPRCPHRTDLVRVDNPKTCRDCRASRRVLSHQHNAATRFARNDSVG